MPAIPRRQGRPVWAALAIWGLLGLLAFGCAAGGPRLKERSASALPAWVGRSWQDKDQAYFSGSASEADAFEDARELAVRDAMKALMESLGVQSQARLRQVITQNSRALLDEYSGKSVSARLKGLAIQSFYFERWGRPDGTEFYKVHALLAYPMADYGEEKSRLARLGQGLAATMADAKAALGQADWMGAMALYEQAVDAGSKDDPAGLQRLHQAVAQALGTLRLAAMPVAPGARCGGQGLALQARALMRAPAGGRPVRGLPFVLALGDGQEAAAARMESGADGTMGARLTWMGHAGPQQAGAALDWSAFPGLQGLLSAKEKDALALRWAWRNRPADRRGNLALEAGADEDWRRQLTGALADLGFQARPAGESAVLRLRARLAQDCGEDPELGTAACRGSLNLSLDGAWGPRQAAPPAMTAAAGSPVSAKAALLAKAASAAARWLDEQRPEGAKP